VPQKILEAALADQVAKALHASLGQAPQPTFGNQHIRGPPDAQVYTLQEFCHSHRLSRSAFYDLAREGLAPRTFRIGNAVRITAEAAAEWRAQREAAHSEAVKKQKEAA
jgi:predicted DNA-binding transcriptional regulator AlpA